jgi:flagellar biosynthesis protein
MTEENKSAIALKYDKHQHKAPHVIAKGEQALAEEILRLAQEHDVPIYEDKELVMALAQVEIGDEIPEVLYLAIAEVIAFVYQLENKQSKEKKQIREEIASRKAVIKNRYEV